MADEEQMFAEVRPTDNASLPPVKKECSWSLLEKKTLCYNVIRAAPGFFNGEGLVLWVCRVRRIIRLDELG